MPLFDEFTVPLSAAVRNHPGRARSSAGSVVLAPLTTTASLAKHSFSPLSKTLHIGEPPPRVNAYSQALCGRPRAGVGTCGGITFMSVLSEVERDSSRWYAAQTRAQCEDLALRHLARQGFTAFCPRRRAGRKVGRHHVDRLEAFFRGYVFVRLDLERCRWRSVNGTVGVARLVSFGAAGRPAALPVGLIEHIQYLCRDDDELIFDDHLMPGDPIRIMAGPFASLCGTLEAAEGPERITILLDLLSRETRVQMSRSLVARAA